VHIPVIGATADQLHTNATAAIRSRAAELDECSMGLHQMAIGLAQVAANYSNIEVQVVTNFENGRHVDDEIARVLPRNYDLSIRPHR
jgi:hypothetical protein